MKFAFVSLLLAAASASVLAQGGTGAPNPAGQSITPEAASAAEKSVAAKHDKRVASVEFRKSCWPESMKSASEN